MKSLRRDAKETALCGAVVLAVWYATQLAGFGSAIIQTTAAVPVEDQRVALAAADAARAGTSQTAAVSIPAVVIPPVVSADVADIATPEAATAIDPVAAIDAMVAANTAPAMDEPIVMASLPDPSSIPAPELSPVEVAIANPAEPAPDDIKPAVSAIEILRRMPGRGRLHRPLLVGALSTDPQARHRQDA